MSITHPNKVDELERALTDRSPLVPRENPPSAAYCCLSSDLESWIRSLCVGRWRWDLVAGTRRGGKDRPFICSQYLPSWVVPSGSYDDDEKENMTKMLVFVFPSHRFRSGIRGKPPIFGSRHFASHIRRRSYKLWICGQLCCTRRISTTCHTDSMAGARAWPPKSIPCSAGGSRLSLLALLLSWHNIGYGGCVGAYARGWTKTLSRTHKDPSSFGRVYNTSRSFVVAADFTSETPQTFWPEHVVCHCFFWFRPEPSRSHVHGEYRCAYAK